MNTHRESKYRTGNEYEYNYQDDFGYQEPGNPDMQEFPDYQDSDYQDGQEEYLRQRKARQRRRLREEKRRRRLRRLRMIRAIIIGCMFLLLAVLVFAVRLIFFPGPVRRKVTAEAGTQLDIKDFLKKEDVKAEFVTDVSEISLDHVGEHKILLKANGKERKSRLIIKDTIAPKAKVADSVVNVGGTRKAEELVTDITDATDVTCSFEKKPDFSKEGTVSVTVVLTDEGGNKTEVKANVQVMLIKRRPSLTALHL